MKRKFSIATEKEILNGETTDIYFPRTVEVLKKIKKNPHVVMEAWVKKFPDERYKFGILNGIQETVKLLEHVAKKKKSPINVYAMEEGEIFFPGEPILQIEGLYRDFAVYENAILGLISEPSGISTKAARVRLAAGQKMVFSFGTRRVYPAIAPMVERACYIGGFDKVSNKKGAQLIGEKPVGTMPHALTLIIGEPGKAFKSFHKTMPRNVPRIALVDTLYSPKEETLIALKTLGKNLYGVRVDNGDRKQIGQELRWECSIRGRPDVKLFTSGGLDEYKVADLADVYDGFGVGTSVADAPTIDLALKIIEVDGIPRAKVGNRSGAKAVYRKDFYDIVTLRNRMPPEGYKPLLKPYIIDGKRVGSYTNPIAVRKKVLDKLEGLPEELKKLDGSYVFEGSYVDRVWYDNRLEKHEKAQEVGK